MHSIWRNSPFLRCMAGNQLPMSFCTNRLFVADAFILASSPSPSLLRKSTSPKGRGLGKEMKFMGTAKGSPFGRAGALAPERARTLTTAPRFCRKRRCKWPLSVTTPPVKMRLERSAERDKREIKNNFSAEYAQSNAERIQNRLPQNRYKENPWNL